MSVGEKNDTARNIYFLSTVPLNTCLNWPPRCNSYRCDHTVCALALLKELRYSLLPFECTSVPLPHLRELPTLHMGLRILVALLCALTIVISASITPNATLPNCANQQGCLEAELYMMLVDNIRQNSRKLKLEDFSWGLFAGTRGRLLGLRNFTLWARTFNDDGHCLNAEYRLMVPQLRATWEKSSCMGYGCAMTIELDNCEFAVRLSVDGTECAVDHLAYLQQYAGARCHANYERSSPMAVAWVETTVRLLSYALNTKPFEKIVIDNVNHALLRLPLFNTTDIRWLCDGYRLLHLAPLS